MSAPAPGRRGRPAGALALAGLVAVAALLLALWAGRGLEAGALPGLPDPGRLTRWALPLDRLAGDLLGTATVGLAVTAAFLLPGQHRTVALAGYRLLRAAGALAAGWVLAVLVLLVLTVGDLLGTPPSRLGASAVASFATSVAQGQALLVQAVLAAVVAVLARVCVSRNAAAWTAVLAVVAVLPPAFTGHAAGAGNHQIAVTSLALHVAAAALWAGGLVGLLALRRGGTGPGDGALLATAAGRYSRLALFCFVAVAVSGLANAWVRLGTVAALAHSGYGLLVLGKVAALATAGGIGVAHRRRTLVALRAGTPRAFRRLAGGEVAVFGAAFGLAVALSRTPTPVPTNPARPDPVVDLLGFPMPAAPSPSRLLGDPLPDMFFLAVVVLGTLGYLAGVWRMRRAGHHWPPARTASWLAGLAVLAAVTNLGLARYAYVLFSMHMAQHMVLSMLVPILLVGGAPATLALRALRPSAEPGVRGPRDWLLLLLHSRFVRLLSHPVVALAIYVASLYVLYLTSLLTPLMRYHLGHLWMLTHFVLAGYLLFWVLVGVDPGRRRLPPHLLILVHFTGMVFHAFFGVVLLQSSTVIAAAWYRPVHPPWAAGLLADQHLGAAIAWSFGEIPAAVVFVILMLQWIRSDEREQVRLDRAAARADATGEQDELARYNEFLAAAARAEGRPDPRR